MENGTQWQGELNGEQYRIRHDVVERLVKFITHDAEWHAEYVPQIERDVYKAAFLQERERVSAMCASLGGRAL